MGAQAFCPAAYSTRFRCHYAEGAHEGRRLFPSGYATIGDVSGIGSALGLVLHIPGCSLMVK